MPSNCDKCSLQLGNLLPRPVWSCCNVARLEQHPWTGAHKWMAAPRVDEQPWCNCCLQLICTTQQQAQLVDGTCCCSCYWSCCCLACRSHSCRSCRSCCCYWSCCCLACRTHSCRSCRTCCCSSTQSLAFPRFSWERASHASERPPHPQLDELLG